MYKSKSKNSKDFFYNVHDILKINQEYSIYL